MIRLAFRAALVLLAALSSSAATTSARGSCWAEVALDPARAVVGQQVLYRVRITSRDDVDSVEWSHSPAFPNVRTESLPGDPQPGGVSPPPGHRVRDERRALFAERPGRLALRAPDLRCRSRGGTALEVAVPEASLEVVAFPDEERPADFARHVGPLALYVTVTPQRLRVGESLRVAVMAQGRGNLWTLPQLFADGDFGSAEVFAERPELVLARGPGLFLRHHFAYDVVPREPGAVEVPALELAYFDPESGGYPLARSEAVRVIVEERAAGVAEAEASPPGAPARGTSASPRLGWWLALPALLLLLVPLARRWRAGAAGEPARAALAKVSALEADGDLDERAAALARALRAALAAHVPDAASAAPEELLARGGWAPSVSAAVHLLAALERARFDPEAPPPDAGAVRRVIEDL